MRKATGKAILFTAAYLAAGLIAVTAVGWLTFRKDFLHFPEPMLSFLVLGVAAALIYAAVQMDLARYAFLVVASAFITRLALSPRSFSFAATAVDALLVGLALMAGAIVQKSLANLRLGRFISMALILGAGYALMTLAIFTMLNVQIHLSAVWDQTLLGLKLGAALGLGFELVDLIGPRPEYDPLQSRVDSVGSDS